MIRRFAAFTLLCVSPVFAEALSVAELKTNEKIVVSYSSSGCFHSFARIYTITTGTVAVQEVVWKRAPEKETSGETTLVNRGAVALSNEETAGLDKLLDFYRSAPPGGCTTVDQINVTYWRDGKTVGEENFVDGSCSRGSAANGFHFFKIEEKLVPKAAE